MLVLPKNTLEHDKTKQMSFANAIYMRAIVLFFKKKKTWYCIPQF